MKPPQSPRQCVICGTEFTPARTSVGRTLCGKPECLEASRKRRAPPSWRTKPGAHLTTREVNSARPTGAGVAEALAKAYYPAKTREATIRQLLSDLRGYVQHLPGCNPDITKRPCDCGLAELLTEIDGRSR